MSTADDAWQEWLDAWENRYIRAAFPPDDGGQELRLAFMAGFQRADEAAARRQGSRIAAMFAGQFGGLLGQEQTQQIIDWITAGAHVGTKDGDDDRPHVHQWIQAQTEWGTPYKLLLVRREVPPMTADRDDLAAILGRIFTYSNPSIYVDEDVPGDTFRIGDVRFSTRMLASMVLESDWLRGVRRDDWAAGYRKGADDHYKCGDVCKVPTEPPNPYRADRADNTTDRTYKIPD